MCNPPPPPPQGVNGVPFVTKLYASSGKDISKYIEGGSTKFTTLGDYILFILILIPVYYVFLCSFFFPICNSLFYIIKQYVRN